MFEPTALFLRNASDCRAGRFAIFDGTTTTSDPRLMICGGFNQPNITISSSKNALSLLLRDDENRTSTVRQLFKMHIEVVDCQPPFRCIQRRVYFNGKPGIDPDQPKCGVPHCIPNETGALPTHFPNGMVSPSARRTVDHSWPWLAEISHCVGTTLDDEHCHHICGATLISQRHLLSAAHCFEHIEDASKVQIRIGLKASALTSNTIQQTEQRPKVEHIIVHPNYSKQTRFDSDLAIIRLLEPGIVINEAVRPACLPVDVTLPSSGSICYVAGFGLEGRELNQIALPVIPNSVCQQRLESPLKEMITDNMLCAGYQRGVHDSCHGDSGGPLTCKLGRGHSWTVDGIVSFGPDQCGTVNQSGVYVRISKFISWVKANVYDLK